MADYIFIRKSRNALSSLMHVLLNLALAVVSIGATVITGNCLIGLILIFVSKWRIFAVNHRYWLLNIRSSLVDFIVGAGFVLLAYAAGKSFLPVHFALMAAYAIWLIVLKPRSSAKFAITQALTAILVGSTAASIFAAITNDNIMSLILVVSEFIIGYAASNHVLVQASDTDFISRWAGFCRNCLAESRLVDYLYYRQHRNLLVATSTHPHDSSFCLFPDLFRHVQAQRQTNAR